MLKITLLLFLATGCLAGVHVRAGDPMRFVTGLSHGTAMGIRAEGPLRARCYLIPAYTRELTLGPPGEAGHPPSVADLAARLDVPVAEVPAELVTIGRTGSLVDHGTGAYVARDGSRLWVLARGYLLVRHHSSGFTQVFRLEAPTDEFEIRPDAGLIEMLTHPRVRPDDIGAHLLHIDRGVPVNWDDRNGY